jgi:hypothetical protein
MKGRLGRPRLPLRQKVPPLLAKQRCFRSCRAKRNKMSSESSPDVLLRRRRLNLDPFGLSNPELTQRRGITRFHQHSLRMMSVNSVNGYDVAAMSTMAVQRLRNYTRPVCLQHFSA